MTKRSPTFQSEILKAFNALRPDPINKLELNDQHMRKYEDKLSPLLHDYHQPKDINDKKRVLAPIAFKNTFSFPVESVLNLNVKPGEPYFVFWFIISSYFPLTAACLGPLSNMVSIIALIQHWRQDKETGHLYSDTHKVVVMNALSLALGIIGNISLLMNFSRSVKYLISQCISIFAWFCASCLLTAAVLVANYQTMTPGLEKSEGFYFACFTAAFYFSCTVILLINFLGYKLKKYPATFNLDQKQRTLMVFTIFFTIWTVCGSVAMEHLISDLTYGSSMYYCIVSFLTIGLGDVTPHRSSAKVVVLIFSLGGVLIMGLIVASLRSVILSSAAPAIFWNDLEKARIALIDKLERESIHLTPEEAFHKMRVLRRKVKRKHGNFSIAITLTIFMLFWLIGGFIFHKIEKWTYFQSIYFCFLCLLTIGYGDYAPKTNLGRTFFISWSIGAVPLMTILISSVGDQLYDFFQSLSVWFSGWFFATDLEYEMRKSKKKQRREDQDDIMTLNSRAVLEEEVQEDEEMSSLDEEDDIMKNEVENEIEEEEEEIDEGEEAEEAEEATERNSFNLDHSKLVDKIKTSKEAHENVLKFLEHLKSLIRDSVQNPQKKYTHKQWQEILRSLDSKEIDKGAAQYGTYDGFWLGPNSPLRLPLKEPNYMILRVYFRIEEILQNIMDDEIEDMKLFSKMEHGN
ncbi:unnamed protein product [Candida verbasci]|uniref:Potassium channel domain-containing protein n=1 Tax=Candida verbasci TaxID=1227364 RepID=A0A9W4XI02_9ASCO|nr:unnamed protein product [Candida verbasci]